METKENLIRPNKFEIKSSDVQDVMNNPPHAFITWGIVLILVILCGLFSLLNAFKVYKRITVPITISKIEKQTKKDSIRVILMLNTMLSSKIRKHQPAILSLMLAKGNSQKQPAIGRIDSIGYTKYGVPILYFETNNISSPTEPGMIGTVEVTIQRESLPAMLFDRLMLNVK